VTSVHIAGTGVVGPRVISTYHWVPQVELSAPESHLHVPGSATAPACLVRSPRVLLAPTTSRVSDNIKRVGHAPSRAKAAN